MGICHSPKVQLCIYRGDIRVGSSGFLLFISVIPLVRLLVRIRFTAIRFLFVPWSGFVGREKNTLALLGRTYIIHLSLTSS